MESLLIPLGLLGLAAFIGGIVGFFSMFASSNKENRLKALEREFAKLDLEVTKLNVRMEAFKNAPIAEAKPIVEKVQVSALNQAEVTSFIIPDTNDTLLLAETHSEIYNAVEDDVLTKQALAVPSPEANTTAVNLNNNVADEAINPPPLNFTYIEPNLIERGLSAAKDWLLGGNTLVRSGIVILFIGISFLIKYATEHTQVPIELRMMGIAFSGIGLLALGWRLRNNRPQYAWALQGGGIGILYLTIFAAFKLYQLIPPSFAFALLIVIAALSALVAVLQSAMPLAILGFTGGFLAPILTSSGDGNHIGLFSYYLVLNLGIAFVALHKSWRPLNVLGFVFTFIIGTLWGVKNYTPEYFTTTEPFLIIHFLLFTAIAVLYAHRQAANASDYVDATLVFGTPLVGFGLQYALLHDSHFGLAYSALALGVFYLGLAWWILTRQRDTLKFLGECFLALGVGFITLTLPLALDGRWTSAAWAVEGVGLLWVGLRQHRKLPAFTGLALQLLAAIAFSKGWGLTGYTETGHQNMFLGVGFIALSGWVCGALLHANPSNRFSALSTPLAFWGWAWWIGAGLTAIDAFAASHVFVHAGLAFVAFTSLLLPHVANILRWQKLAALSALLLPAMAITLLFDKFESHPFAHFGALSWLVAFAIYIVNLQRGFIVQGAILRLPLVWIAALVGAWEWRYQLTHIVNESPVWHEIGWAVVPLLLVAGITFGLRRTKNSIPSNSIPSNSIASGSIASSVLHTWAWLACAPLVVFLAMWFMWMSLYSNGNAAPLIYVPLINPLDIALVAVLLLLLVWHQVVKPFNALSDMVPALAGLMSFTLINGMLLRTLHHWAGTPFRWTAIFNAPLVQMSFTFLWAVCAFILMLLAHKRAQRKLWIVGASLMGLVVAKIFLLDMAQSGSVERIASFIGAGLMLLVMGYFAPLPPTSVSVETMEKS